jgi:transposase
MTRAYAWSKCGQRAIGFVPRKGQRQTLTVVGAIALDGVRCLMAYEGGTTNHAFMRFVREALIPSLHPGDVVVMDNLAAHRAPAVAQSIRAAGADVLYLPPYHHDLNPIEHTWSKLKSILRRAAARTLETLSQALATTESAITTDDLAGWYRHCGYAQAA